MRREIKRTVYKILAEDEYARANDNYLIVRVVQELEPNLAGTSFIQVMNNLNYKGISMEGITRARRKYFEEYPYEKVDKAEKARRKEEENYFMEYSKHIPVID